MKVLYVSKAMVIETYRDKLEALGRHVDLTAVVPAMWGSDGAEPSQPRAYAINSLPVRFSGHNHLHYYRKLRPVVERVSPDLVHIDEEPYSAVTFQLASLSKRRHVPAVFFAWQNLLKRLPPPFGSMQSYVFGTVAGAIAGTHAAAHVLTQAGYTGPVSVIPQVGVATTRFTPNAEARAETRARLNARSGELLVGYGGRLVREKGVHLLTQAAAQLPDLRLVFLGDGPERARLERSARQAYFAGHVPSAAMPHWLAGLDILVLPSLSTKSWREQFGRILVEAMACGVPVIGSSSGEIPAVAGDAGVLVPEGDVSALVGALRKLSSSPSLRCELAQRACARVHERYSQERIVRDTVTFYHSLVAGSSPS